MRVALSAAATREFEAAVEWWRANRPLAPTLLEDEMSAVLERLAVAPLMGRPVLNRRLSGLRRVSLEGARYNLYYRLLEKRDLVWVVRLWHMSRRARL